MKEKILLDTDIGSDIDDAVCLAYLLAQPRCELVGITTVTGQALRRAKMASALCRVAGRDVPIIPGCEKPFLVPQKQTEAPQADALSRWPHSETFPNRNAVEFMRSAIRSAPGEITLLAIGPLTNVGALFAADPEIPGLLKALVLMCGVFTTRTPNSGRLEWNAIGDPHATAMVYAANCRVHRSIGLDVTLRVCMSPDEVRRRFRHPLLRPVLDFAEVWFRTAQRIVFHDPLAAVTIFDSEICRFSRGRVEVELASRQALGMTHWQEDPDGRHEIAIDVDPERFFQRYFEVF